MAGRTPSGTFSRAGAARAPIVVVPTQKFPDRAAFCGCCCTVHRNALLFILAVFYLAIALLSMVAVGAGVDSHMTYYSGQVKVDTTNYKITQVKAATLSIWTGWLKYNNGLSGGAPQDLANLSTMSAALGFLSAFILICSFIISTWKFFSIMCCGGRHARDNIVCLGVFLSVLIIALLLSFYGVTSRDLDDFAHRSLNVSSQYDVAMAPDYAWYSGFFAGVTWFFVSIFAFGLPTQVDHDYHQF